MHEDKDFNDLNVGEDSQRPADNMTLDYDPMVDPGTVVGPVVDPNTDDGVADDDHASADGEDELKPASMAMTKAELLDRLHEHEDGLTKAQIIERIRVFEDGDSESVDRDDTLARAFDTATRQATVDGQTYTWTEASEDTVPEEARLIWARSQAARG